MTVGKVGAELRGVGDAQDVDEQLGQLVGVRGDLGRAFGQALVPAGAGHHGLLVAERCDAGPRRGDGDVVVGGGERPNMVADDGQGLGQIAAVDVHLLTTALAGRENDLVAQPFQDADGGQGDLGCIASTMHVEKSATHRTPVFVISIAANPRAAVVRPH